MNPIHAYSEQFPPSFREHIEQLENDSIYRANFQKLVRDMTYSQWLNSPKWKYTARLKRLIQQYCEKCNSRRDLEVHHRTYDYIGIEVLHLDQVEVLCRECHEAIHRKDFAYSDRNSERRILTPDNIATTQLSLPLDSPAYTKLTDAILQLPPDKRALLAAWILQGLGRIPQVSEWPVQTSR